MNKFEKFHLSKLNNSKNLIGVLVKLWQKIKVQKLKGQLL